MDEILKQRIEKKSKELGQMFFPDNMNPWARANWEAGYVESACEEMATFALKNQWISVDEALPPRDENISYTATSVRVLVRIDFEGIIQNRTAVYDYSLKKWSMYDKGVTHWMLIPSLEGGE